MARGRGVGGRAGPLGNTEAHARYFFILFFFFGRSPKRAPFMEGPELEFEGKGPKLPRTGAHHGSIAEGPRAKCTRGPAKKRQ